MACAAPAWSFRGCTLKGPMQGSLFYLDSLDMLIHLTCCQDYRANKRKTIFGFQRYLSSNKSKTSASVWPRYPDTEKQMKAWGHRPSAFIVSRCLETLVKHDAQVFDMVSKTIHFFSNYGVLFQCSNFPWDCVFENNQNVGNLLLFVVNHVGVKMAESFAANAERDFVLQKPGKKNQSWGKGVFLSQLPTKPNGRLKFFTNGR